MASDNLQYLTGIICRRIMGYEDLTSSLGFIGFIFD